MKYLVLVLAVMLTACGPVPQDAPTPQVEAKLPDENGCIVDTNSTLVSERKVGKITNLIKEKDEDGAIGTCTVKFDITVDGKTYHLEETENGLEQLESLCYYAKERARKNLLLDLGGTFESKASVSCKHTAT
jgi:hypothetical protein